MATKQLENTDQSFEPITRVGTSGLIKPGNDAPTYRPDEFTALQIVNDDITHQHVRDLRKHKLGPVYPRMDLDNDPLDYQSLILYSINRQGTLNSTARLSLQGSMPLPEEDFLHSYRQREWKLCEWGRFAIEDGDKALLKAYYRTIYLLALRLGYDAIVMAMKPKDIPMHRRLIGVKVAEPDMKITYGGKHSLACVVWELHATNNRFFTWSGAWK